MNRTVGRISIYIAIGTIAAVLSACGSNNSGSATSQASSSESARPESEAVAQAKVALRRAYVGSNIDGNDTLNEAKTEFAVGEQVYVGVLLSSKPELGQQAVIAVEAFDGNGNPVGEGRAEIVDSDRATLQLAIATGTLTPGAYAVVVKLNGVPSWQVKFSVR